MEAVEKKLLEEKKTEVLVEEKLLEEKKPRVVVKNKEVRKGLKKIFQGKRPEICNK